MVKVLTTRRKHIWIALGRYSRMMVHLRVWIVRVGSNHSRRRHRHPRHLMHIELLGMRARKHAHRILALELSLSWDLLSLRMRVTIEVLKWRRWLIMHLCRLMLLVELCLNLLGVELRITFNILALLFLG